MDQVFRGRTEDAAAPFLGTDFWSKDVAIEGTVERVFKIEGRNNYAVKLQEPVEVDGEQCEEVSLGESAGFRMALQAAKVRELQEGDRIMVRCTGETASKGNGADGKPKAPRKNFEIEVMRNRSQAASGF